MKEMLLKYAAVGIYEKWDMSMQLFNATIKSSVRSWDSSLLLNAGITTPERDEVLRWAYLSPEINIALAADILLYDYALSVFKKQTSAVLGVEWRYHRL